MQQSLITIAYIAASALFILSLGEMNGFPVPTGTRVVIAHRFIGG